MCLILASVVKLSQGNMCMEWCGVCSVILFWVLIFHDKIFVFLSACSCHKKGLLIRCDLSSGPLLTSYSSFTMMSIIMTSTIMTSLHSILVGTLLLYITVYMIPFTTETLTKWKVLGVRLEITTTTTTATATQQSEESSSFHLVILNTIVFSFRKFIL